MLNLDSSIVGVANAVLDEMRQRSQRELYRNDYHAWRHDILGYRSYEKMNEITWECLHGEKSHTAVASANGVSKSWEMSCMIAWASSVFEPGDVTSIVTAPSIQQVEKVIWAYLKNHFSEADARNNTLPGRITEKLEWVYDGANGKQFLAYGRVPSPGKEMAVFQGVRGVKGKVFVFSDEGGAIGQDMFSAMEAVTTGSGSKAIVYGNPDYPRAYWRRFWDKTKPEGQKWNTYNISAYELPSLTGEVVYPDDEVMNTRFLSAITSKEWVKDKELIWPKTDARFLSKVMGQFPEDDDFMFFPRSAIDASYNTEIEPVLGEPIVLGVDIARYGTDESILASNQGGKVKIEKTWSKSSTAESAKIIVETAHELGASEVRIDSTGIGGGVYDDIEAHHRGFDFTLVGWDNGSGSPDKSQWSNKRAYSYDNLRSKMVSEEVALPFEDEDLREELLAVTYKFNNRGAIQISPKDEIKKDIGGRSPDRLDAVVLATLDMSPWTGNPYNAYSPGDKVYRDPDEVLSSDIVLQQFYADQRAF